MEIIIQIEIELNCGVSQAFNLFTVNEKLESWLPKKAEVELNSTIGCEITSLEKNKFISFEWKGPEKFQSFMNFSDPLTHVVAIFSPKCDDPKTTTLYLFHSG